MTKGFTCHVISSLFNQLFEALHQILNELILIVHRPPLYATFAAPSTQGTVDPMIKMIDGKSAAREAVDDVGL